MYDLAVYSAVLIMMLFSSEGKIRDTTIYMEEIVSTIYPLSIKQENVEVYEMPSFYKSMLHEFRDGGVAKGVIYYRYGNVTGFQTVQLKTCDDPSWQLDNLVLNCTILFPRVTVIYAIDSRLVISYEDSGTIFRQRDFGLKCDIINMESVLESLISPRFPVPLLKRTKITYDGKPVYYVIDTELPEEPISLHIAHNFNDTLREIFHDVYMQHFARAFASLPYSLKRAKTEL